MPSAGDIINVTDISTIVGTQLGCVATPISTSSAGTVTVGSTETRDAVLGNYVFTVPASQATWRYRAVISGIGLNGSASPARYAINIRDGGAATPTNTSTLVGNNSTVVVPVAGTGGVISTTMMATYVPGAGTHTLSVFVAFISGSGTATPTGSREFYVECLGPH